jgi:hypothetical protein
MVLGYIVIGVIIIFLFFTSRIFGLLNIDININEEIPDVGEIMSLTFAIIVFITTTIYLSKRGDD